MRALPRNRLKRTAVGTKVYTTPRDLEILDFIQRHTRVTTHEVFLFLCFMRLTNGKDSQIVRRRLRDLFNERGLIERPKDQRDTDAFHSNYLICTLTEAGEKELGIRRHQYATRLAGWEKHLYFLTRLTAWMELACLKNGLQFIHRDTLFSRADHPNLCMKINDVSHIPDDIFGINYGDRKRYFALEADRATEDLKTIFRKIDTYDALLHSRDFMKWGVSNLTILICTLSHGRAETVLTYIKNNTRYPKAFLLKAYPAFADRAYAKASDLFSVLEGDWQSVNGPYSIMRP